MRPRRPKQYCLQYCILKKVAPRFSLENRCGGLKPRGAASRDACVNPRGPEL